MYTRFLLLPDEYHFENLSYLGHIAGHFREASSGPICYRVTHAMLATANILFLIPPIFTLLELAFSRAFQSHLPSSHQFTVHKGMFNICQIRCTEEALKSSTDNLLIRIAFQTNLESLKVEFIGKKSQDLGGLSRQFILELLEGIVFRSEILTFDHLPDETVSVYPRSGSTFSNEEKQHLERLGYFLGIVLRIKEKIQPLFNSQFIRFIYLFLTKAPELDLYDEKRGIARYMSDNKRLYQLYNLVLIPTDERMRQLHELLLHAMDGTDKAAIKNAGIAFNQIWGDEDLSCACEEKRDSKILKLTCDYWGSYFSNPLQAAYFIAKGMQPCLQNVQDLSFDQFSDMLQGEIEAETIIRSLTIDEDNRYPEAEEIKGWMTEWVEKHRNNKPALQSFIRSLTGGVNVSNGINIVAGTGEQIVIRTCFNKIIVPKKCEKTVFMDELDQYGNRHVQEFNDY